MTRIAPPEIAGTIAEPSDAPPAGRARSGRARRLVRHLGTALALVGACGVIWVIVVWLWQDPFTALYTTYQQHKLAGRYETQSRAYQPPSRPDRSLAAEQHRIAVEARRYRENLREGDPVGRLDVPHLGLRKIVVNGTGEGDLEKGPGRYVGSFVPGEGQLIYIAGHRTTFGAPFAHIDRLAPGDRVTVEVPYGTFVYRVRRHVIVPSDDLARLRSHGHEVVALQACHPRFFATHRYIVYAVPVRVIPTAGRPYSLHP